MKLSLDHIRLYENFQLLARKLVEGFITGLHKSPYHGFSVEFAEHRLYNNEGVTTYLRPIGNYSMILHYLGQLRQQQGKLEVF